MMKKLFFAAVLAAPLAAHAQPAEGPGPAPGVVHEGTAPEQPGANMPDTKADQEKARLGAAVPGDSEKAEGPGKEADEEIGDPSEHFNWFNFSYRGKDELGGTFGDGTMEEKDASGNVVRVVHEEEPMSAPFVFMLLNFAILLGILVWKGRPAVAQIAAERHDAIKTALDEAARLRKQAEDKLHEYETRLSAADAEIAKLVEGMKADADADKKRILATAEAQAQQMKRDADQRIAAEIELARAQLTREVTAAATAATEKLLREKMNPADQQKLVASFIADLPTKTPEARS